MGLWRRLKAKSKSSTRNSLASDQIGWETMESFPQLERPNVYANTPLNDPDDIRLLELLPGEDDPISCRLKVVSLGSRPLYTGISYTWGDDTSNHDIQVNGFPFRVRSNLLHLLRDIRHGIHVHTVWIDAVCINQNDMAEKNSQVARMAEIYKTAVSVTAWLKNDRIQWEHDIPGSTGHTVTGTIEISDALDADAPHPSGQMRRVALEAFFNHAYWSRRWIIQEIVLARSVLVHCGKNVIPLMRIQSLALRSDGLFGTNWNDSLAVHLCTLHEYKSQDFRSELSDPMTLSKLLEDYRTAKCKEPLDTVYALLSLSQSASRDFRISYNISPLDLLQRTVDYASSVEKLSGHSTISFALKLSSQLGVGRAGFVPGQKLDRQQHPCVHSYLHLLGRVTSAAIDAKHHHEADNYREHLGRMLHCTDPLSLVQVAQATPRQYPLHGTLATPSRIRRGVQSSHWEPFKCQEISPNDMFPFLWQEKAQIANVKSMSLGFATARVQPGDLICRFDLTPVALVLREQPSGPSLQLPRVAAAFDIVARARLVLRNPYKSGTEAGGGGGTFDARSRYSFPLEILDIETRGCEILDLVMLANKDF